jgi:hypothetical protein
MRLPTDVLWLSAFALIAAASGGYLLLRRMREKRDPERERRHVIETRGRITEGFVIGFEHGLVHYRWSWRGVDYSGSQDVTSLTASVTTGIESFAGPVSVKFLPENPLNSIVVSENWSGFAPYVHKGSGKAPEASSL